MEQWEGLQRGCYSVEQSVIGAAVSGNATVPLGTLEVPRRLTGEYCHAWSGGDGLALGLIQADLANAYAFSLARGGTKIVVANVWGAIYANANAMHVQRTDQCKTFTKCILTTTGGIRTLRDDTCETTPDTNRQTELNTQIRQRCGNSN